jgi:sortase (surface protein transpeptidase)
VRDVLRLAFVVAVAAATTGGAAVPQTEPRTVAVTPVAAPPAQPTWTITPAKQATTARPVRLRVPAIGVDTRITDITVNIAGQLIPPPTTDVVGWYTGGPAPGDTGPALLAGHVDSRAGPGVFFHLADLHPGDRIAVDRADHTTARFHVVSVTRVVKSAFPTDGVYAPEPVPLLRLITCGGTFDRAARSYRDNVIVEAAPDP